MLLLAAALALSLSPNHRFLQTSDGQPFFWLADTAWLLQKNLTREEATRYLDHRAAQGFNVLQVMVLHTAKDHNAYGVPALIDADPGRPFTRPDGEDFWTHLDWLAARAAERNLYLALVPAWGSLAKAGELHLNNVTAYSEFLARRYGHHPNIVWLVGGDIQGDLHPVLWRTMGRTLKRLAPHQLVTYHPFGRRDSSEWFHSEPWLDFNMFQSGHQNYAQDPKGFGEDNWRYVERDYALTPVKPVLDGEPSYENIPHGLHDASLPHWNDSDVRRYAYWSVFAGSLGHSYGENSVMQFFKPGSSAKASYGNKRSWEEGLAAPGAAQLIHLKRLILSRPFFDRVPDQRALPNPGERYDRVVATRTSGSFFAYCFSGRPFEVDLSTLSPGAKTAWWFNPRDGSATPAGRVNGRRRQLFIPPQAGQDWVLVLDDSARRFPPPGR